LCIAWGTTAPEQDKALIDTMAAGFELIGSAEVGSGSGGRMEAGGAPTPDGGGEQPTPPQIDWEMRASPTILDTGAPGGPGGAC